MKQRDFNMFAGGLVFLVGLAHLLRAVYGWQIQVHETAVPIWASWVAVIVTWYLAWSAFQLKK